MGDINTAVGTNTLVLGNGVGNHVDGVTAALYQDAGSSHDGFNFAPGGGIPGVGDINVAVGTNTIVAGNGVGNHVDGVAAILDQDAGSSHNGYSYTPGSGYGAGDIDIDVGTNTMVLGNGIGNDIGGVAALLHQDAGSSHTGFDFGAVPF